MSDMLNQPAVLGALISAVVAMLAATASLVIGLINWRQSRRSYSSAVETRIEDLYDRLMDYRLKHPEVFRLSRRWTPDCLTRIYSQESDVDRQWAIYIGYVELCISYCNAAIQAERNGRLEKRTYRTQHEPLMKMLITEHFPVFRQLTRAGGFVSTSIVHFIDRQRERGWDWELEYERMDKVR